MSIPRSVRIGDRRFNAIMLTFCPLEDLIATCIEYCKFIVPEDNIKGWKITEFFPLCLSGFVIK